MASAQAARASAAKPSPTEENSTAGAPDIFVHYNDPP
jgi:hypothetical protein